MMRPFQPGLAVRLSKSVRLLIGALTIWPIVYFVVIFLAFIPAFFIPVITGMRTSSRTPQPVPPQFFPFQVFGVFFALQFLTIILVYGLMALYIVDVFRNDYIVGDRKALWAAVLFLGSFISMPVYWYLYFWRDRSKDVPAPYPLYPPYPPYPQYAPYQPYDPYGTNAPPAAPYPPQSPYPIPPTDSSMPPQSPPLLPAPPQ